MNPFRWIPDQLRLTYNDETIGRTLAKLLDFRAVHLLGRVLREVSPKAADETDGYRYMGSKLIAGLNVS